MRAARMLLLLVPLVAGCGDVSASYVGSTSDSAVYVKWTRSDASLKGELTRASVAGGTQRVAFTGSADGSSVSLRLARALGARTTLNGALVGETLTIDYPGEGEASTIMLRAADKQAFDSVASALRTRSAQEASTPTPEAAATSTPARPDALMDAVRAAYDQVRTDETMHYTDTICDDVSALRAAVQSLRRGGATGKPLAEAQAMRRKADAACRKATGGS
jgi:hypothetical protein